MASSALRQEWDNNELQPHRCATFDHLTCPSLSSLFENDAEWARKMLQEVSTDPGLDIEGAALLLSPMVSRDEARSFEPRLTKVQSSMTQGLRSVTHAAKGIRGRFKLLASSLDFSLHWPTSISFVCSI